MPGTFTIDTAQTFATALLMACAPKTKFGETGQDHNAAGLAKWEAQVAVTFLAEPGMRPISEVISVTIAAERDPAAGIAPGTVIELDGFRVGWSAPEARDNGRIRGGKPWYQASGLRSSLVPGRVKADAA